MLNKLPGGKGDKLNPKDVDQNELKMGIKHEMEHTKSASIAQEIALDHLAENPKYYSDLNQSGIDEIERMQKLAGIQVNELGINNPNIQIPEGWSEIELDSEDIKEGIVHIFSAPMDGHDENHTDTIQITNSKDNKFIITTYYAFGNAIKEPIKYSSINLALKRAYEIMTEISDDWDNEDDMDGFFGDEDEDD